MEDSTPIRPRLGTERPGAVYLAAALYGHAQKGLSAFGIYGHDVQESDDENIPEDVAQKLLQEKTPLPVITVVLGHKNVTSTMFYIRIDKPSLSICALDVPVVPASFYAQKGGFHK